MKLRAYLTLGRPSNLPTVWTNVLAGTVLAGGSSPQTTLALMFALSCLYTGGMFLNDAFDRAIDARERPERPIPSGKVTALEAFAIGAALLAIGVAVVAYAARAGAVFALALAGAIVLYDAWHKRNPVAPFIMGACRGLVYITAGAAAAGAFHRGAALGGAVLMSYVVGLTYVARQENLATFRGFWPLAFLSAPLLYGIAELDAGRGGLVLGLLLLAFSAWTVIAVSMLVTKRRGNIGRAVIALIAGISIADAVMIAASGQPGTAVAATAGLLATLGLQRWVRGT